MTKIIKHLYLKVPKLIVSLIVINFLTLCFVSAEVKIVGSNNIPNSSFSKEEIKNIFLGKTRFWDNNKKISVAMLIKSSTQHEFHKEYLKISLAKYIYKMRSNIYKGKGKFPKIFDTDQELIEYLSSHDNIIGYVSSDANISLIKEFTVN